MAALVGAPFLSIFLVILDPLGLPAAFRGLITVLAVFAGAVVVFDAVYSLVYDWMPYARENLIYRHLSAVDISAISAQPTD